MSTRHFIGKKENQFCTGEISDDAAHGYGSLDIEDEDEDVTGLNKGV